MEILIDVPTFLQPIIELWLHCWSKGWLLLQVLQNFFVQSQEAVAHLWLQWPSYATNVVVPIVAVLLVFWPILLSLIMALGTAWAWIFWIITSILLGIVQVAYASYQFFMITMDICGLSMLKTYTMIRHQFLWVLDSKGSRRKSRRKLWRQRMEDAQNYENFLKIRIEPKDVVGESPDPRHAAAGRNTDPEDHHDRIIDSALPKLGRSSSFTNRSILEQLSPSKLVMARNLSFSGDWTSTTSFDAEESTHVFDPIVVQELSRKTADLLVTTTSRLEQARFACLRDPNDAAAASTMQYLLAGVVKRNHLQLDELLIENARSVAEAGQYGLSAKSRHMIRSYYQEVEKCLDCIADAPARQLDHRSDGNGFPIIDERPHADFLDRLTLMRKMKQNMGRTALMLSGGGAQAMYHLGVVRALIESKLYNDIKVISGTSGGSITAGMCAIKTAEELFADVCVNTVSTDFMLTGEMKKHNIRWFPSMYDMATYWLKHKLLVDSAEFGRTCEFYFKDCTFEEAFLRTGKHVCITVSASRASGTTAQRLLLNHISTPHVTIASAVRASCALPGVMAPAKLVVKSSSGILEPFEVDGVEWIDGSVQADLPFQRIATLFSVTSFVVSQTNFHVVPFLNKEHHPNQKSLYWRLFQTIEWDIRSRALKLSRLGLFPRIFGQDITKIFKQKYHGNLTIVPRFTTMQTFGLKALSNPSVKDMDGYLKYSQIATWPYLNVIRDMIRLEKALDDCLARLEARIRSMHPESDWSTHDDIESIESSSMVASSSVHRVRIVGRPSNGFTLRDRDNERLRRVVSGLERENQQLRDELDRLRSGVPMSRIVDDIHPGPRGDPGLSIITDQEEDFVPNGTRSEVTTLSDGSEGMIWNLVRGIPPP